MLVADAWEDYELKEEASLELHLESSFTPDLLQVRKEDGVLVIREPHLGPAR